MGRPGSGQQRQKHLGHLVEYILGEVVPGLAPRASGDCPVIGVSGVVDQ